MRLDGLTPRPELTRAARSAFQKPGLIVMVRPRGGNFCYTRDELRDMRQQIQIAADCGVDGVVLGALRSNGELAEDELRGLVDLASSLGLAVGFHRAFDALPDRLAALHRLDALGIHRVLTSGTVWGQGGTALEGVAVLRQLSDAALNHFELVIGGGVCPENIPILWRALSDCRGEVVFHAFSAAYTDDSVDAEKVRQLVSAASHPPPELCYER
jgi:copper homeostasis protein